MDPVISLNPNCFCFTGKPPFYSDSCTELTEMILHQEPPPPRQTGNTHSLTYTHAHACIQTHIYTHMWCLTKIVLLLFSKINVSSCMIPCCRLLCIVCCCYRVCLFNKLINYILSCLSQCIQPVLPVRISRIFWKACSTKTPIRGQVHRHTLRSSTHSILGLLVLSS